MSLKLSASFPLFSVVRINNGRLAMVAMAAIVAQNGATGQSLVEQFTTGNLNPFIGGYAKQVPGRTSWRLQGFCFSMFGVTWIFHMMEKKPKGLCQVHQDFIWWPFGRHVFFFGQRTDLEGSNTWFKTLLWNGLNIIFPKQAATRADIYRRTFSPKTITKHIISRYTFSISNHLILSVPVFWTTFAPACFAFSGRFRRRTAWCFAPIRRRCHGSRCLKAWWSSAPSSVFTSSRFLK